MIYHITTKAEWDAALTSGSLQPESLVTEGFIHCSTSEQWTRVASFYFRGRPNILLLEIDESLVDVEIRWEGNDQQKFPHIYGPLKVFAVTRFAPLVENADGEFADPFPKLIH